MTLIEHIRSSLIGDRVPIDTPFGQRPLVYADYTASGRSLSFIEDYIRDQVLPYYANTHTETTFTGAQTTVLREQARQQIRSALNGGADDQVIFCGPGATVAINKLIDILNLRLPRDLSDSYQLEERLPESERPVVFIGPYEHHSNELPWRESIAEVVCTPLTTCGQIDIEKLEAGLQKYADRPLLIGSFSAASNVTGVKSDIRAVTKVLKKFGALSFWDYAAAAPYIGIDMNSEYPIDGVFISPHKYVGGPGTPGILVAKRAVFKNSVPAVVGGGTVAYVTPEDHLYIADCERREEGGTPAIVESIRAGLVFKLQQEVGTSQIEELEKGYIQRALSRLSASENLEILGDCEASRLSILSLRFKHGEKDLHYGFIVSLLNDLFGIQVRGGCSCAGPYGHSLLGMDMDYSRALEAEIQQGGMILRPGWVRLNFNYFIAEEEFEYLLQAIELVAEHGWRILPAYIYDPAAGVWRYRSQQQELPSSLNTFTFADGIGKNRKEGNRKLELKGLVDYARSVLVEERYDDGGSVVLLSQSAEKLRWFVLPQDLVTELKETA